MIHIFSQVDIDAGELDIPTNVTTNSSTIETILTAVFATLGSVAFIVIVVAGLQFVLSRGDAEKAGRARNTIIYAAVGLVIAMLAFGIVRLITESAG